MFLVVCSLGIFRELGLFCFWTSTCSSERITGPKGNIVSL